MKILVLFSWLDNVNCSPLKDSKADVLSVSPSSVETL